MRFIVTTLAILATGIAAAKDRVVQAASYSVATELADKLVWPMDGDTLTFGQEDGTCTLKSKQGELLHQWEAPLKVTGAVNSENGRVLLVRIMTIKGFFHGVTRFILKDGKWTVDDVLLGKHPDMDIRSRWIDELGAVADDGATAIVHVGEADSDKSSDRTGFRMFYSWQTWDLNKTKKIGTGLKMCNGNKEG